MQTVARGALADPAASPRSALSAVVSTSPLIFQQGVPLALPSLGVEGLRNAARATPNPFVGSNSVTKLAYESSSSNEPVNGFWYHAWLPIITSCVETVSPPRSTVPLVLSRSGRCTSPSAAERLLRPGSPAGLGPRWSAFSVK